jgi:DNA invertase Pin-like site-specific DNA recombinase
VRGQLFRFPRGIIPRAEQNADWHQLLEICAMTGTLICDEDGLYDPRAFNDRMLLGLSAPS